MATRSGDARREEVDDERRNQAGREDPDREERQAEGGQIEKPRLTTSAMIASLAAEGQPTKPAPFGHALAALAAERPEIVGLTADLSKYTDLYVFAQAYPDRYYQMGMAEQLLMSAAAGMAREGFLPLPPPTPSSPRGELTTSSVLRSPRRT